MKVPPVYVFTPPNVRLFEPVLITRVPNPADALFKIDELIANPTFSVRRIKSLSNPGRIPVPPVIVVDPAAKIPPDSIVRVAPAAKVRFAAERRDKIVPVVCALNAPVKLTCLPRLPAGRVATAPCTTVSGSVPYAIARTSPSPTKFNEVTAPVVGWESVKVPAESIDEITVPTGIPAPETPCPTLNPSVDNPVTVVLPDTAVPARAVS
jgi:hypothetical protein